MASPAITSKKLVHTIPYYILDDICCRFIINVPNEERTDMVRLCFKIELAHWFYLDYYCTDETENVDPCGITQFAAHIFQYVPFLQEHHSRMDEILNTWRQYKRKLPTHGAIILDSRLSHVLLVQSYRTKVSWSFPKGKVNENEEPWTCATREVFEETGFDISNLINKQDYIEATINNQNSRLYFIGNVPRDTKFQPRTRNEIKACKWFPIAHLPTNKKDKTPKVKMGVSPKAFFMVMPFVKRIRKWVAKRKTRVFYRRTRHKSMEEMESNKSKNKTISQGLRNEIQEYQQNATPQFNYVHSGNNKRQFFTPQNIHGTSFSPVLSLNSNNGDNDFSVYSNFVSPSWSNFKFNK